MVIDATRSRSGARIFASLSSRNYRLFFWGQLISICGTWMQWVAQSFLVLQLTDSGTVLGLATAARFVPIFLFGPWGGVVADRLDKRRVLYVTQSLSGLLALAFGVLVGVHAITMWMVYLLALALGFVNVFDVPARQSFISEMVPRELLRNAVTLNSVTVNLARILGAAAGGGIASVLGLALCFDLNAASFVAVVITLLLMRQQEMLPAKREEREPHQVRAGLSYVRREPELLVPLLMVALVGGLAWEFPVSLPLMAQHVYHGGAGTYGTMTAVMGAGAAAGGLITASRSRIRRSGLAVAAIGWGLAITAAALAPDMGTEFAALLFVGYGSVTFNSLAKTVLQLSASPSMRGRVMALWAVAWQGSTPVGGPIVGWAGQELGARWALLVGGVPTFAAGIVAYRILHDIDQRRAERREGADDPATADLDTTDLNAADAALADGTVVHAAAAGPSPPRNPDCENEVSDRD